MRGLSDPNAGKLSSIRTYLLIALIFNILAVIAWGFLSLFLFIIVFPVIFLVVSIVILSRTNQMRSAADRGDVATLKSMNSLGWAIVALLLTGVINGIFLLLAYGTINELQPPGTVPPGATSSMTPTQAPVPSSHMDAKYCQVCGTRMSKSAMFCPNCGAPQK